MGENPHGQLGNGTTNDVYSPGQVLWSLATIPPVPTISLINAKRLDDGSFQFALTNQPGTLLRVLTSTNLSLPLTNWTSLGFAPEISPGQFEFNDPSAASDPNRFYQVITP